MTDQSRTDRQSSSCSGKPRSWDCSAACCWSKLHEGLPSGLHWSMAGARNTLVCRQSTLERFARLKAEPKRNVVRVARLRRPPLLSTLRFSAVKLPNVSRCLCSRQPSWAPCWQHSRLHLSMLMTFPIWRSSSVHWHDVFWGAMLMYLKVAVSSRNWELQ